MFILDALFLVWLFKRWARKSNLRVAVVPGPDTGPATPSGGAHGVEPVRHAQAGEPAQTLPQRAPEPPWGSIPDSLESLLEPVPAGRHEAPDWLQDDEGAQIRAEWAQRAWDGLGTCQHPVDVPCHASRRLTEPAFA